MICDLRLMIPGGRTSDSRKERQGRNEDIKLSDKATSPLYDHIILCILTIGFVGFGLDRLMSLLERRFRTA